MKAKCDETLEEIWEIRRQIAKSFDFDPRKQVAHYQRKQKLLGAKIYRPEVPSGAVVEADAALHDRAPLKPTARKFTTPVSYRVIRKRKAKPAK